MAQPEAPLLVAETIASLKLQIDSQNRPVSEAICGDRELVASYDKVLAASDFVGQVLRRDVGDAAGFVASIKAPLARESLQFELAHTLESIDEESAWMSATRRFRNRKMACLAWRDIAGFASLDESLAGISDLADICIDAAVAHAHQSVAERHGEPLNHAGKRQQLVVLAMGKLGGQELNYSSDVDLVLAYPEPGETDGRKVISNGEFFTKVIRKIVALLDQVTAEGFVFRVDTRLRPFGHSGPPAMHFSQMEDYFAQHGRDWERYAWIKARPCAGDIEAGEALLKSIKPFIYRRYLDFTAIDGLRRMKSMIEAELANKGLARNIKLGRGGIREIEFVVQVFQLVRGGTEPELNQRRLFLALAALDKAGHLPSQAVEELREAYCWLRIVENRLQQYRDQQTHDLPSETQSIQQQRLAYALGYDDWAEVEAETDRWRKKVHARFRNVFAGSEAHDSPETERFRPLWEEADNVELTHQRLGATGFSDEAQLAEQLRQLRCGNLYSHLDKPSREQLDALVPCLLQAAAELDEPAPTALRMLEVIAGIGRRGTYFALLAEHAGARTRLANLCAASSWITKQITAQPLLLDELLNDETLYDLPDRAALEADIREQLESIPADDLEQRMDRLRQLRNATVLHIAAADVTGRLPIMKVSDRLTELAEVLLEIVIDLAWDQLKARHGEPQCVDEGGKRHARFAVLAYGKAGGLELGYGSDLDLVFLHDSRGKQQVTNGDKSLENTVFFSRLVQRIVHLLSASTAAGRMYEIDTRLRPSGKSGLMVSSIDAFAQYQEKGAWTWEHQALIRARVIASERDDEGELVDEFAQIRQQTLAASRDPQQLKEEVIEMREKMREHLQKRESGKFDVKQGLGGITDIEFMVQYAVLRWAEKHPALLRWTDNIRLLETLASEGLLSQDESAALVEAYKALRSAGHKQALQERPALVDEAELLPHREAVQAVWRQRMATK